MKIINTLVLSILILMNTACAGTPTHVKLHVVDDDAQAVDNADVDMRFLLGRGVNRFVGFTDKDGKVSTTQFAQYGVSVSIKKDNYYDSGLQISSRGDQDLTMVLRQKKNPIAMYAKKMSLPKSKTPYQTWIGYDLEKGDFLPPYGEGVTKDIEFNRDYKKNTDIAFSYHLKVRFPNSGDGLVSFYPKVVYSHFKSDYLAPLSGYKSSKNFYYVRKDKDSPRKTNFDKKRNYYFRVRSEIDAAGNVTSAYYGKIYGEIDDMASYFNPIVNDRNVEFDPQKNLNKNLTGNDRFFKP